jgi:glutathione S-transferase
MVTYQPVGTAVKGKEAPCRTGLPYLDARLKDREFLLDHFGVADGYLTTVLNWTRATPEIDLSSIPT